MRATRLLIKGTVQGVGFRPAVYQIATKMKMKGFVKNIANGLEIVINDISCEEFLSDLKKSLPRLAKIDSITHELIDLPTILDSFTIAPSSHQLTDNNTNIPIDSCICQECITDIFTPNSKYYLYPFTNCSNCGPRYTVIEQLPYDRSKTALNAFPMCNSCQQEFNDPSNRRYHAIATTCPNCGPCLDLDLAVIAKHIQAGDIVALKTIGGYTLIADANNSATIKLLRERKERNRKPFALMASNVQSIKDFYCDINTHQQHLLESYAAPIVIMPRRDYPPSYAITTLIAPGLNTLGFMLPHSPIHYLLFYYLLGQPPNNAWLKQSHALTLVVTSANLAGGSIVSDNDEAKKTLSLVADIVVGYNRNITIKCDDSVILPLDGQDITIRRARGLAPKPYNFNYKLPEVLGLGAHLKNTLCFTRYNQALLSQYLGDMDSQHTISYFHQILKHYKSVFNFTPELLVSDLHPDFYTTIYANEYGFPHIQLQHHYAHFAATIASAQSCGRELNQSILGCILDGYGYGDNGGAWGGELIKFDLPKLKFDRISHLPLVTIPGGNSAKRNPWKLALAWCLEHNLAIPNHIISQPQVNLVSTLIKNQQMAQTSSAGDLFSLVSALLGICNNSSYEAESALLLESIVTKPILEVEYVHLTKDGYPDIELLIKRIYHIAYIDDDLIRAVNVFYANLAALLEKWIVYHTTINGISQVAFSGGCWQSRYLLPILIAKLRETGIDLLLPYQLPFNDECISLGQAWYGAQCLLSGKNLCV
jgi:hydrogenase maturation protein HypF